ncbi:hypothetical protein [Paraglaciecola sp. L3A3]|uniref:hypothetical protein n=1 Tax=Paraglaciecola sp. L3A3 TaxID=2686358 RepID=UPI00131E8CDB|nr:hypothetical protein [Paraglaciecola sp. L3A3]
MNKLIIFYKYTARFCVSILMLLAISSCSTTKSVATWTDHEYNGGPLKKIVVIGVFKNLSSRKEFEEKIAKKISENSGVEAVPSLRFLTPGVKYEHKSMEKMFSEKGFDGILIVRTKSVDNISTYVPGGNSLVRNVQRLNYPSYHNYYLVTWKTVREPAYFDESYIVSTESSLFLNSNDKMIWTMEKRTEENYRAEDGITKPKAESTAIAGLIFNSLKSEKLLIMKGKY